VLSQIPHCCDLQRSVCKRLCFTIYTTAFYTVQLLAAAISCHHELMYLSLSLCMYTIDMYLYMIGAIIRRLIEDYWKKTHIEEGYELLYTPHVANLNLWKTSGHFDFYKDVSNTAFLCNCSETISTFC
jgi:threonyl-tRNA synthetase